MLLLVWVWVEYVLCGNTPADCVSACCYVHNVTVTLEGVVFSDMPNSFPADAGILAKTASDFLSSGMGHRIPGPGWLHPPEVLLEGRINGGRKMETYPLFIMSLFGTNDEPDGKM